MEREEAILADILMDIIKDASRPYVEVIGTAGREITLRTYHDDGTPDADYIVTISHLRDCV